MITLLIITLLVMTWAICVLQFIAILHLKVKFNNFKTEFLNYKLKKYTESTEDVITQLENLNKFKAIYSILESQLRSIAILKEYIYPDTDSDNNLSEIKENDEYPIYSQED